jgi:hypothetical protein
MCSIGQEFGIIPKTVPCRIEQRCGTLYEYSWDRAGGKEPWDPRPERCGRPGGLPATRKTAALHFTLA